MRRLILEIGERIQYNLENIYNVTEVWEDRTGTKYIANSKCPLMTTHMNNIGTSYYWFRTMIKLNQIDIHRIDTKEHKSNMFTKRLTR